MKKNPWEAVSQSMIERYDTRYQSLGRNIRTLGWGSEEQQLYRFEQTLAACQFEKPKKVLDVGCGFGDYLDFLMNKHLSPSHYHGIDITPSFVEEARKRWDEPGGVAQAEFSVYDISSENPTDILMADYVVMLGLLNLRLSDDCENYAYSEHLIGNAFRCAGEVLIVDFLSSKLTPDYPREDFIFYHEPIKMLEFALSLTPNVVLKHNYAPIPQKEFMLFMFR